jgi:hypothetical protein
MDLAKFDNTAADTGMVMQLLSPVTDEPTDSTITLYGADSSVYRCTIKNIGNRRMQRGNKRVTSEAIEAEGIELLTACTASWENIEIDGEVLKCTPENIKRIYTEFIWVREQVDAFIGDRANFLSKS